MATIPDRADLEIRRLNNDADKLEAEARKLMAEAYKFEAEKAKLSAERSKLESDTRFSPWIILAQGTLAAAALMGAGAAIAKLLMG